MEKDYRDHLKYNIKFECAYIVPSEKGMTESIAKEKAMKRLFSVAKKIEKQKEKEHTPKVILDIQKEIEERRSWEEKELRKLKGSPKKLTLKNQLNLFKISIEKMPKNGNYFVWFRYEFVIITKISDESLVQAIAMKEAPFSMGLLSALNLKVKRIYE